MQTQTALCCQIGDLEYQKNAILLVMSINEHPPHHVPVLLESCVTLLNPQAGETYLDLTAGYGGHARAILERTQFAAGACLVDRDEYAISQLSSFAESGARLIYDDFVTASRQLLDEGATFQLILLDLGVSSPQLDRAERGFSFTHQGPLDMRMDRRQLQTARTLIQQRSEAELAEIITRYGEEPRSVARRYAAAIKRTKSLETTKDLADAILSAHIGKWQHAHPATRTFQALRIAVNDELEQVRQILSLLPSLLAKGGRVGVISFHSLEDRLVKQYFAEQSQAGYEAQLRIITKKPHRGAIEDASNPRARSATLRVAIKT